jgi:ribosomal protein L7/L12
MPECPHCQAQITGDLQHCPQCGASLEDASKSVPEDLPETVRSLMSRGDKIEAIKLFRERTGAGLPEAKAAVEALHQQLSGLASDAEQDELERLVLDLMARSEKIEAIKVVRQRTKWGLKEAKDFVEALAAWHGIAEPNRAGCLTVLVVSSLAAVTVIEACS